jgi:hypothetical protein
MNDSDISDLGRMLPVPDARDFQAGRQQTLKEHLMTEIRIAEDRRAKPSPARRARLVPRRTTVAASAAAALVLLGGASYGAVALASHAPGTAVTGTTTAALTVVKGCAALRQADGTLEQVNGTSLVITTASGRSVTVTTTGSTAVHMSYAPLSDIADGDSVIATGHSSGGTIAADRVSIAPPAARAGTQVSTPPGIVAAQGTVTDASATGFTVVTSGGAQVQVTTSSDTNVNIFGATVSQLQPGAATIAVGYPRSDGTLSAIVILSGQPGTAQPGNVEIKGCSPTSVEDALMPALPSGT